MNQVARASQILHKFVRDRHETAPEISRTIKVLLDYIHENLFNPNLNVKTAMHGCTLRDNNITSKFRLCLGVGMHEYIETLRMEAAANLLEESDLAVIDIATCLGYDYPQTFYRIFNRSFGCTPARYRERSSRCLHGAGTSRPTCTQT